MRLFSVYWLHDERCTDVFRHGYIGCSTHLPTRIAAHRRGPGSKGSRLLPASFEVTVLFTGSETEALALEKKLRPYSGIGWNINPGGGRAAVGYKHSKAFKRLQARQASARFKDVPKSDEHREKIRAAALRRWADPAKRAKQSKAVKKGLKGIDRSGANNPRFGKHCSEATKQKIRNRIAERGGINGANNPNWRGGRPAH
jgi:predicted GIY-YIG superfamily endonuclease